MLKRCQCWKIQMLPVDSKIRHQGMNLPQRRRTEHANWTVDRSMTMYCWTHATWMRIRLHARLVGMRVHDLGVHVLLATYYGWVEDPLDEADLHEQVVAQDLNHQEIQIVAPTYLDQEDVR